MRRPISSSVWTRVLALPLALWSAVPGVQWCPVGWADVRIECFAECSVGSSECSTRPVAASACGAGVTPAEGCPSGLTDCALDPCRPDGESSDGPPGGRAYCLSGPAGGDGVPPVPLDAAPPVAIAPAFIWQEPMPGAAERPALHAVAKPPQPATGAVPRIRAPPEHRSTIR